METSNAPQTGVFYAEQSMSAQTSAINEECACMERYESFQGIVYLHGWICGSGLLIRMPGLQI